MNNLKAIGQLWSLYIVLQAVKYNCVESLINKKLYLVCLLPPCLFITDIVQIFIRTFIVLDSLSIPEGRAWTHIPSISTYYTDWSNGIQYLSTVILISNTIEPDNWHNNVLLFDIQPSFLFSTLYIIHTLQSVVKDVTNVVRYATIHTFHWHGES